MKTIKQVFEEFLEEQQVRLKPRTYGGYEDAIYLFEQCLNSYAYQCLDDKDSKLFDKLYNEKNKEFCELFGPDKIGSSEIGEFLDYFMILTLLRAFRLHSKPELFHHDNGGEYDNGVISRLLQMLKIVDVPTEVENPKGNGEKERAHSQDRKYFYDKNQFKNMESVEKAIPEYIRFRNESKGQWARYGKTASSVLKDAEAKPLTDEELERVISELYFEKVERIVKKNGKIKFKGKRYHVGKKMSDETVEVKITLRGVEAWHKGAFIKRWKYWEYVPAIAAGYRLEKYLL